MADDVGPKSRALKPVTLFEMSVLLEYTLNEHEHSRRQAARIGAVTGWEELTLMMELPLGLSVPLSALTPGAQELVRRAEPGVVEVRDGKVIRELDRPLTPELAVVLADDWTEGLNQASKFGVYCPRMLIVNEVPEDVPVRYSLASLYGIGVSVAVDGELIEILKPTTAEEWTPTVGGWRFAELVYDQIRENPYGPPDGARGENSG